jgi:DNA polymerase-1
LTVRKESSTKLLIVDGDYFTHRAYHSVPKTIRRAGGRSGGAIVGFCNALLGLYEREQPQAVVVGWDTLESPTYRHELLPSYQSGREFDPDLLEQLHDLPEFTEAIGFVVGKAAGFEADDFLATAVARQERKGGASVLASADRDMFQLASPQTTILQPAKGGEWVRIGPAEVRARYGVEPSQVPDFIALRGDPSDKIPGAKGVGAATAASLLRKYGTLEGMLEAGRFSEQSDALRSYKRIATMDRDAPLPPIRARKPTWSRAAQLTRDWGLNKLADRIEQMAAN